MACGPGLGILLVCLAQAELVCSSWGQEALRLQSSNMPAGFSLPDDRLRKSSSALQNQLRRLFPSPRSVQSSSINAGPILTSGYDRRLSTDGFVPARSQSVQGSGRLVKTPPSGSAASLFGPVAPAPRGSVRMQTYAQGPARKTLSRRPSETAWSISPRAAAGWSSLSHHLDEKVRGQRPRGWAASLGSPRSGREGQSAVGFAPVTLHDIPEALGGSAIRRLRRPTETPSVQRPPHGQALTRIWTQRKQNQGPVQMLHQVSALANNPHLPRVHPASTWTRVNLPYRL